MFKKIEQLKEDQPASKWQVDVWKPDWLVFAFVQRSV